MADYKDIITGTIENIMGKVKDVANSGSVRGIYEQGAAKAKSYGRIAKLTLELNGQNEELKRVYTEIGKLYYEQAKDAPEGFFAPLFAQAEELLNGISDKMLEIDALKEEVGSSEESGDIEVEVEVEAEPIVDFESVVTATEDSAQEPAKAPDEEE